MDVSWHRYPQTVLCSFQKWLNASLALSARLDAGKLLRTASVPPFSLSLSLSDVLSSTPIFSFIVFFVRLDQMKVMSEAAKVEAKERFDRGDFMGAAKVATAWCLNATCSVRRSVP